MKVIVIRGNLKDALAAAERCMGENQNLPILRNALITARGNEIKITTTNLELAITTVVPGKIIEEGAVCVPAAVFSGIVSNLQTERINLEQKNNDLEIKTDNYEAVLRGLPAEEFPLIPEIESSEPSFILKGDIFQDSFSQIITSAQTTDLRPELNALFLHFAIDHIKLAATDSFRLAEKIIGKTGFESKKEEQIRALIPLKTAHEALHATIPADTVRVYFDRNQILFATERTNIISRLVQGTFPDYQPIIPKQFETEATVNREEFLNALKLAGVFTGRVQEVRVKTIEGKRAIEVCSGDQTAGENKYLLAARAKGASRDIGFNWRYLSDGLRSISTEEVFLGMNEDNKPAVIKPTTDASRFYLLMPILRA